LIARSKYQEQITTALQLVQVVVLIGARQVGKSTLMQMQKFDLPAHFINGQDPENAELFQSFSSVKSWISSIFPQPGKGILLIDEFQYIPGISLMIKLITDHYPDFRILCSGSSSLDIRQKVEESLAGRVRIIEVYSLSFSEYLSFCDESLFDRYNKYPVTIEYSAIDKSLFLLLKEYILYGGLPKVALTSSKDEKLNLLNDIYQTYLLRDVRNFIRNEDTVGFNKILRLLSLQNANLININELSRTSGLSNRKCEEYLSLLEQMYIVKLIEPMSDTGRRSLIRMKKVYFLDTGIRNLIAKNFNEPDQRTDYPYLLENYVLLELIRSFPSHTQLNFFRTYDNLEIDFILNDYKQLFSIEVKAGRMKQPKHFKGLNAFNTDHEVNKSYLINDNLSTEKNGIWYLPAILVSKIYESNRITTT
jgi:uncharacterized protein